jgi:thioester reductase-like protein
MKQHLLLTGATGLLGQYLLRDLLFRGTPVAVLTRPGRSGSAAQRIEQVVAYWEEQFARRLPRPFCLEGDITVPGLGLSDTAHRWIVGHCSRMLHNAASLTFTGQDRQRDPWLSNVCGTAHVLDLCRATGIQEIHYVSTAYVCGQRGGTVSEEELDRGQDFRNDYESSKCEAEKRVRAASFLGSVTVYRPAVIVGDSATGYTSTYHGLYSYLYFAWLLRQYGSPEEDGRLHLPVRLTLTGEERRNLVCVDWVSAVISHVVHMPEHHGRTYHLTPLQPVTARQIEDVMSGEFKYYGPTFGGPDALAGGELNDLEKAFYDYVARYQPYWFAEPTFDCSNTRVAAPHLPCPTTDGPLLRRLIGYAIRDRWGKGRK